MRKPSPAFVLALAALFVALGGVGVAATGGNFILGKPNSATSKTSLAAGINDRALLITNSNTGSLASALSLSVAPNHPPLVVSSGAGKATNLDADKLDGVDSSAFTQGGGRLYSGHREGVAPGASGTLLEIPDAMTVTYDCRPPGSTRFGLAFISDHLAGAVELAGETPRVLDPTVGSFAFAGVGPIMVRLLGSRAFNRTIFRPGVLVDARVAGSFDFLANKCSFQAVADVFR
jgi:hypothetical protein